MTSDVPGTDGQANQVPEAGARRAGIAAQADAQYRALGRFVAKFEQLMLGLRRGITILLQRGGLRDEQRAYILLADVMAEDLRQIFFSLLAHDAGREGIHADLFDHIRGRIERLTNTRNLLLHNPLFIGWASTEQTELGPARGFRLRRPKEGHRVKPLEYSSDALIALGDEADALANLVGHLSAAMVLSMVEGGPPRFAENFTRAKDSWVTVSAPA